MTQNGGGKPDRYAPNLAFAGVIIAAILGLIVAVINAHKTSGSSSQSQGSTNSSSSAVVTSSPSSSAVVAPVSDTPPPSTVPQLSNRTTSSTEPATSPPAAPLLKVQYLSDLTPVGGEWGNYQAPGTASILNTTYANSVLNGLNTFSSGRIDTEFSIPAGMQRFKAMAGLDDQTPSGVVVVFEVSLDTQGVVSDQTLGVGTTYGEDIPLQGAHRLTLTVILTKAAGGPGHVGRAVWGNARFER
jgi:hypothetical protein